MTARLSAAWAWLKDKVSFRVIAQTDLWTNYWALQLDLGSLSLYAGIAKDK